MMNWAVELEVPILPKHVYDGTDFRNNSAMNAPMEPGRSSSRNGRRSFIQLERNDSTGKEGRPYLDRLIFRFIADAPTAQRHREGRSARRDVRNHQLWRCGA